MFCLDRSFLKIYKIIFCIKEYNHYILEENLIGFEAGVCLQIIKLIKIKLSTKCHSHIFISYLVIELSLKTV